MRFNILDAVQQQIVQAPSHERSADNVGGNNTNFSRFGSADVAKHRVRAYFQSLRDQLNVQEVAALTVFDTYRCVHEDTAPHMLPIQTGQPPGQASLLDMSASQTGQPPSRPSANQS